MYKQPELSLYSVSRCSKDEWLLISELIYAHAFLILSFKLNFQT